MKKLTIFLITLMFVSVFTMAYASAYNMSKDVSELQEEVQTFNWESYAPINFWEEHITIDLLNLVYKLLAKVVMQDVIIQELSLRPVSCSCGGGSGSQSSAPQVPVEPEGIKGDANGDGFVGQTDLDYLIEEWGMSGDNLKADFNNDGFVGQIDQDILNENWGMGSK